jgi:hypothetical protein
MVKADAVEEGAVEVIEYDWDRVKQLIEIVDLLRGHPNLKPIADAALLELEHMVNPPVEHEPEEDHPAEFDEHGNLVQRDEEGNILPSEPEQIHAPTRHPIPPQQPLSRRGIQTHE